jgi:hypothetical protein
VAKFAVFRDSAKDFFFTSDEPAQMSATPSSSGEEKGQGSVHC